MNLWARLFFLLFTIPFRGRAGATEEIKTHFRCWPTDLDANLHMNNGIYFSIMDLGRLDLMFRTGSLKKLLGKGLRPVVIEETMRFRRAINLFDSFTVTTQIVGWTEQDIYIEQKFWVRNQVCASAHIRGRLIKTSGGSLPSKEALNIFGYQGPQLAVKGYAKNWSELRRG